MLSLVRKNEVLDIFEETKIVSQTKLTNYQMAAFIKQVADNTVFNSAINFYLFELSYKMALVDCFSDYELTESLESLELDEKFMKLSDHLDELLQHNNLRQEAYDYCIELAKYHTTPAGAIISFTDQIQAITNKIISVLDEIEQGARKIEPQDYEKVVDFAKRFGVDLGV